MIEISNVSFSYNGKEGPLSLKNIDLRIRQGECVLLCGSSGCGKTTVTKLVNGLIPHFDDGHLEGSTAVGGMRVSETPLYKLSMTAGSVFQNPKSQFFNIDSDSELAFGLENNGTDPDVMRSRIARVTEDLRIGHLLHRNVFSMSGGEKQALAFASVYAMDPDIYVLDEPSANLDQSAAEVLRRQLCTIRSQGKTIIIAEHRLYYLTDLIDRAVYLRDGAVYREFTRDEFKALTEEERHELGLRTIIPQDNMISRSPGSSGTFRIEDLSVRLKKHTIFSGLDFAASPGKVLGILGHNGAGKSTLLRCLAGLQKESAGRILYNGRPLRRKERSRLCYMIMQDVNHQLFADSVWNECLLACGDNADSDMIEKSLCAFDLYRYREKHPLALSGGQKQRLAIVTGILAGKKVLMFDEPTSGLDHSHMRTVSMTLRRLSDAGHIVIVVTHDMELLNSTCDEVLEL